MSQIDLAASNISLSDELSTAKHTIIAMTQRVAFLEQQLNEVESFYVPPADFLPPKFFLHNQETIEMINDYALLYRQARRALRETDPTEADATVTVPSALSQADYFAMAERLCTAERENAQLKKRISVFAAENLSLKQENDRLRSTLSRP